MFKSVIEFIRGKDKTSDLDYVEYMLRDIKRKNRKVIVENLNNEFILWEAGDFNDDLENCDDFAELNDKLHDDVIRLMNRLHINYCTMI